jgi:hypothetical protein
MHVSGKSPFVNYSDNNEVSGMQEDISSPDQYGAGLIQKGRLLSTDQKEGGYAESTTFVLSEGEERKEN